MPEPPPARRGGRGPAPRDHTPERVLALAGVAALLGVFIVMISLISGASGDGNDGSGEQVATATEQPTRTPDPTPTAKPKPTPVPLTAEERTERQAAADVVASR